MVSSPRLLAKSGVNPKGFFVTALVLLLVVALFFIPELVSFQKSISQPSPSATDIRQAQMDLATLQGSLSAGKSDPSALPQQDSGLMASTRRLMGMNPLDEVSAMLNPSYLDEAKAKKALLVVPKVDPKGKEAIGTLSWDTLRSGASVEAIRQAEQDAIQMSRQMPREAAGSRFALLNFASSLRVMRTGGEKVMQPVDAVRYVDFTRLGVVRAMEREGVDRGFYNRFVTFSLGPVLDAQRGVGIADVPKVFSPILALTRVSVFRQPTRRRNAAGQLPRVLVSFGGYTIGREVKQIEVYRNGVRLARVLPRRADSAGVREFSYNRRNQRDGRGVFTLRITDQLGQVVERNYAFYPRARQFGWMRNGYFKIPRVGNGDRRLDRFFAFGRDSLVMAAGMGAFDGGVEMERF